MKNDREDKIQGKGELPTAREGCCQLTPDEEAYLRMVPTVPPFLSRERMQRPTGNVTEPI